MKRISETINSFPSFIGSWDIENNNLCNEIIRFFEDHPELHTKGELTDGIDEETKKTTDLPIFPNDLTKQEYSIIKEYMKKLYECYEDYMEIWPFLKKHINNIDIGTFQIQKYNPGDHFQKIHSERTTISVSHRILVWMTYLNDVDDGGNTFFENYDLKIKPTQGKTLIWPAEWTHAHSGEVLKSGVKYIITGWMNFPYNR